MDDKLSPDIAKSVEHDTKDYGCKTFSTSLYKMRWQAGLSTKSRMKSLAVFIDNNLTRKKYVHKILKKVSSSTGNLLRKI